MNSSPNLIERTQQLQKEIQALDENGGASEGTTSFFSSFTSFFPSISLSDYSGYIFASAVIAPFIIFGIVYNTKYALNETGEKDRKKVLKLSVIITVILWIVLYCTNWYINRKDAN